MTISTISDTTQVTNFTLMHEGEEYIVTPSEPSALAKLVNVDDPCFTLTLFESDLLRCEANVSTAKTSYSSAVAIDSLTGNITFYDEQITIVSNN